MSDDGGGEPPPTNDKKFPFLKRGTGTQKYQKINYMRRKSSDGRSTAPRPSATSVSSEAPSTSTALEIDADVLRPVTVPQLNLEVLPDNEHQQDRDSGRESAAPLNREQIHNAPPTGRVDSGFSDYRNIAISPNPSHYSEERTFVNDQDETTFIQPRPSELAVPTIPDENDEVFANDHHDTSRRQVNESLKSFLQNEEALGREPTEESELSTPTRNLLDGIGMGGRVPSTSRSQSSGGADLYQPDGPLCSTPIQELSLEPTLPPPRRNAPVLNIETPILRGFNRQGSISSSGASTRPASTASTGSRSLSTPTASFEIDGNSRDNFSGSGRLGFEPVRRENNHRSPPTVPNRLGRPAAPSDDELRRAAIRNNASAGSHRSHPIDKAVLHSLTSSDETPLRKRLPQTHDPVVKELRKQLRNTIAHMDLTMAHLHDYEKKLRDIYDEKYAQLKSRDIQFAEERARLADEREKFEMDRHEWQLEQKKRQIAYQKDREALIQREEAHRKQLETVEKDCKDQTLAARTGAASLRVSLNAKDQENKKLKAENEKIANSKTRLEKLLEQIKTNHSRDLKAKTARITELEKQLATHESEAARRRNGIQPRPKPAIQLPSRSVSLPETTFTEPEPIYEAAPEENPLRRQVRFDLDANQYQEFSSFSSTDLTEGMIEQPPITGLSMGLCRPFVDSWNRTTYMYELRHIDGTVCGALLYKFHTNNSAWLYGPIEVFLYHRFPLVVKIPAIDLELRVLLDQVEVHRPHLEISRYDLRQAIVTDTRRRKDGSGFYAIRTSIGRSCEVIGQSDRDKCEDEMVLRRGSLREPREYMKLLDGGGVWWQSGAVNSPDISDWLMVTHPDGKTKIRVSFNGESVDIFASPSEDLVLMRHKFAENKRAPCCDIGKAARDRERNGEFVAFGKELLARFT